MRCRSDSMLREGNRFLLAVAGCFLLASRGFFSAFPSPSFFRWRVFALVFVAFFLCAFCVSRLRLSVFRVMLVLVWWFFLWLLWLAFVVRVRFRFLSRRWFLASCVRLVALVAPSLSVALPARTLSRVRRLASLVCPFRFSRLRRSALVALLSLGVRRLWFLPCARPALAVAWLLLFRPVVRLACFRRRGLRGASLASVLVRGLRLLSRLVLAFRSSSFRAVRFRFRLSGLVLGSRVRVRSLAAFVLFRLRCFRSAFRVCFSCPQNFPFGEL